jgi:hypothetical protein
MKKKILLNFIFFLIFFTYGFVSHKNQIFPYDVLKTIYKISNPQVNINKYENEIKKNFPNWNKLNFNFKEILIQKYSPGINIFTDRHYFNHINDKKLKNLYIIQIPRHYNKNIKLKVNSPVKVLRTFCKRNKNDLYKNWHIEDFKITIIGEGCVHEDVVSKKFSNGFLVLKSGGPFSSDPIFIDFYKGYSPIEVIFD